MIASDEVQAIPLWINGHAYLTMAPAFFDVRDAASGEIRRRTPLCGAAAALSAVQSAAAALPAWSAQKLHERAELLALVGAALAGYAEHFAALLSEETGKDAASATAEVCAAVRLLRSPPAVGDGLTCSGIIAVVSDESSALFGLVQNAVPALLAGATVVLKPSPKAPSAAFALAELSAESGFPGGVVNVLHGDLAAIEGLCATDELSVLCFAGDPALAARVAAIAARHGKPCDR